MFSKSDHSHVKQIEVDMKKQQQQQSPPSPTFGVKVSDQNNKKQQKKNEGDLINIAGKVGKSHHAFLKLSNQYKPGQQQQLISLQQLSKHKASQSAWLSLNGVVYDVTLYLAHHPGGKILLEGCGKQCSDMFNAYHPWVNAKFLLAKFKIGYLIK